VVSNCVLASSCSGLRIGYAGDGVLADMTFSNLVIRRAHWGIDFLCTARNTYAAETSAAGPTTRDLYFSNIVIADSQFGLTAHVAPDAHPPGGLRGLRFSAMKVRSSFGNYFAGNAQLPIRDIAFRDVDFIVTGALEDGITRIADPLPIFATKPVGPHAFLLQQVEGVAFRDCRLRWEGASGAWQSALHLQNAHDVDTHALTAEPPPGGAAITSDP
jgi:hypothetical protein